MTKKRLFLLMTAAFFSAAVSLTVTAGSGTTGRGVAADTAGKSDGGSKGALDSISDASKEVGNIGQGVSNITGTITGAQGQLQDAVNTIKNPQNLIEMAMDKAVTVASNVAEDFVLDMIATPSTGIPVSAPTVQVQQTIAEGIRKETAEIKTQIDKEKDVQLEAIGGKPATAAPQQTGVPKASGTTNTGAATPPAGGGTGATGAAPDSAKPKAVTPPNADNCPAYMAQFKPATSLAYDLTKENMLGASQKSAYAPAQKNWDAAVNHIKSTFYEKDPDLLTQTRQKELKRKRQEYLYETNSNVISTSLGIQQALLEDAKRISEAPTSGCNLIDDININTFMMMTLVKQTMADIALQIRMTELEAIREQNAQPLYLLERPGFLNRMINGEKEE